MPKININNVSLNYTEAGSPQNRTIVFAHPVLWGAEDFESLITDLAADFHVVAVDIHGHGSSGWRKPLTIDEMTDDFYELIVKLDLQNPAWFGYSIGGMIGMRLALNHPEAIDALVLMATNARPDEPEIKVQAAKLWDLFRDGHRADIADAAMPFFFARNTFEYQPQLVERYRNKFLNFKDAGGVFEAAHAVFERGDISDRISEIMLPTLVIAGSEDVSATPEEAEFIASQIPNASLRIVEDANHLLAVEKTSTVAEAIRAFLT